MKISNETKVGSLTAIAIVLLILGFNFLKGKSFSGENTRYTTTFSNIQGLALSNAVVINGKEVGTVYKIDGAKDMRKIAVVINMKDDVLVPEDSYATINKSLLGSVQLEIKLGNNTSVFKKDGDSIRALPSSDFLAEAMQKLDPTLTQVNSVLKSLDSLLANMNHIFDPESKKNIKGMIDNLNKTTASLATSSASLNTLLNTQTGALAKTLDNVSSFTGALKSNNEKLSQTMTNVQTMTDKFAKLELQKTLTTLDGTVSELKGALTKVNSSEGTLGLMLNDGKLYNNLNATSNKLNLLLDDLRTHPKRYINVSVFGKKDKTIPLAVPLPDTVNAPYLPK